MLGLTFRNSSLQDSVSGSFEFCVYELYEILSLEGLVAGQSGWFKRKDLEAKLVAKREGVLFGNGDIIGPQQQHMASLFH